MRTTLPLNRRSLCLLAAIASCVAARAEAVEILIPSYFYPSGTQNGWPRLNAATSGVNITAILNPDSGPGAAVDAKYTSAVTSLRASGGRVIGYVSTVYGTRPIADVKADILKYRSLYPIDGIFLDEMTNTNNATALNYYADVYAYIKSLDVNYRVTGNPGTNTQPAYITRPTADTLVTFENDTGYASFTPSAWTSAFATRRFSNIPYQIPDAASMVTAVNAAAAKGVGYVYVTDDGADGNPWDRLPTYWDAEIAAVRAITPTWNTDASGDWNAAANWSTPTAPNGIGAEAMLLGAIAAPRTVYTNTDLTLGTLVFNNANRYVVAGAGTLTLDATVESALIDVRRGTHTINLPLTLRDPTIAFIAAGSTLTIADPLTIEATGSLTKSGPGTLEIISTIDDLHAPLSVAGGMLVLAGGASIETLTVADGAQLALRDEPLNIAHVESIAALRDLIGDAYHGGDWTGSGIVPIAAAANEALGYRVIFSGDAVAATITRATIGDANLDAVVDFDDLLLVASHLDDVDADWSAGDFDYDGVVDAADVNALSLSYAGDFDADWQLAQSLVPEPTAIAAALGFGMTAARRRRIVVETIS